MVSDLTRNMVWQEMLDIARLIRYYEALFDRYRCYNLSVRSGLLISAIGEIASLLRLLPEPFREAAIATFSALIALVVIVDFLADFGKKAEVLRTVGFHCRDLESQWRQLWSELHDEGSSDEGIRTKNRQLVERISTVTDWVDMVNIPRDEKVNVECEKTAHKIVRERFTTY